MEMGLNSNDDIGRPYSPPFKIQTERDFQDSDLEEAESRRPFGLLNQSPGKEVLGANGVDAFKRKIQV